MNHTWQPDHRRLYRLQSWGNMRESQRVRWESESEAWFWHASDPGEAPDKGNKNQRERKASVIQMQQRNASINLIYNNNGVKNVNDSYSLNVNWSIHCSSSEIYQLWCETLVHMAVVYITAQNLQEPTINLCYFTWLCLLDLINTILMKLCGLDFIIVQFNKPIRHSRLCNIVNSVTFINVTAKAFLKTFRCASCLIMHFIYSQYSKVSHTLYLHYFSVKISLPIAC